MGLAPGPWVARTRRRMRAAAETRRGGKGRRLDKIIQKIHTTMDFLPECQYLGVGRKRREVRERRRDRQSLRAIGGRTACTLVTLNRGRSVLLDTDLPPRPARPSSRGPGSDS